MKLIVGLGNPDKEYENTRHNIGFMAIDSILKKYNVSNFKEKHNGIYYELSFNNEKVILLKPQKYMNLSGEVIKKYVDLKLHTFYFLNLNSFSSLLINL